MGSTTPGHVCHLVTTVVKDDGTLELDFVSGTKAKNSPPEQPSNAETVVSGDRHQLKLSEWIQVAGISTCNSVDRAKRKKEVGARGVAGGVNGGGPESTGAGPGAVAGAAAGANAGDPALPAGNGPSGAIDGAVVSATT